MSLESKLIAIPQRETAGADTQKRFHYQMLYGLLLILENYKEEEDYAVIFEFHDDIAFLDNSLSPEKVSFYQIKTKERGHWNIRELINKGKTKENKDGVLSVIEKMCLNIKKFEDSVDFVSFVSNAEIGFSPNSNDFSLEECDPNKVKQIVDQIKDDERIKSNLIRFKKIDLSLSNSDQHAKGKLYDFVIDNLGDFSFSLNALYEAIISDIKKKSIITENFSSLKEVISRKAITKKDTDNWLIELRKKKECPTWEGVSLHLSSYSYPEYVKMKKEWDKYGIHVLNTNTAINAVRAKIAQHINNEIYKKMAPIDMIEHIYQEVKNFARARLRQESEAYIKVMIIYEINTNC